MAKARKAPAGRGARKPAGAAKARAKSRPKAATAAPRPVFRPVPLYEFTAGGIAGQARLSDPGRGLAFVGGAEGKVLPAASQETLSLRHYLARGESGLLAPREESGCEGKVDGHALLFRYEGSKAWPVAATARYELLPQGGVDAALTFSFAKAIKGFEAGVETVMPRSQPTVYVHSAGAWIRAAAGPQAQLFYPRNQGAAEMIADGRWDRLRLAGVTLAVQRHGYDYPMLVVRDEKRGWALAYMGLTEDCTCVWVSGAERAIGLGLIGGDVKAQSSVTCRLRVVLCPAERLDDTLAHYRAFVQEARAARK